MDTLNLACQYCHPVRVSTKPRNPNKPYSNSQFDDPGVVVRFERDGQQYVIPCDRWDNPPDNGRAIAHYIDAKWAI